MVKEKKQTFYERNHQKVNFQLATTLFVTHLMLQEGAIPPGLCSFGFPTVIIYIGATRSIKCYDIVEKRKNAANQSEQSRSRLKEIWEAIQAPVYATIALYTIYLSLKHEYSAVNHLINGYYLIVSGYTMYAFQYEFLDNSFGNVEMLSQSRPFLLSYSFNHLVALTFAVYAIYEYVFSNNWLINNYIAIQVCIYSIEKWLLSQFWQICLMFIGLMIYDGSFVWGSDVMMTVAENFESPMKILFKQKGGHVSMLGIGDIIIPGLLTSLCLRIDFIRGLLLKQFQKKRELSQVSSSQDVVNELTTDSNDNNNDPNEPVATMTTQQSLLEQPSRYYFYTSLVAYNLGLIGTAIVLDLTRMPQPALLYICPSMVFIYISAAFLKHQTMEMILYDEDTELKKFEVKGKKQKD